MKYLLKTPENKRKIGHLDSLNLGVQYWARNCFKHVPVVAKTYLTMTVTHSPLMALLRGWVSQNGKREKSCCIYPGRPYVKVLTVVA